MDSVDEKQFIDAGVRYINDNGINYFRVTDIKKHFPKYKVNESNYHIVDGNVFAKALDLEVLNDFELGLMNVFKRT